MNAREFQKRRLEQVRRDMRDLSGYATFAEIPEDLQGLGELVRTLTTVNAHNAQGRNELPPLLVILVGETEQELMVLPVEDRFRNNREKHAYFRQVGREVQRSLKGRPISAVCAVSEAWQRDAETNAIFDEFVSTSAMRFSDGAAVIAMQFIDRDLEGVMTLGHPVYAVCTEAALLDAFRQGTIAA